MMSHQEREHPRYFSEKEKSLVSASTNKTQDSLEFCQTWIVSLQSLHKLLQRGAFSGEPKRAVEQEVERPHESDSTEQ